MKKKIWNFVITGGPCSGKTTGLSRLEQELEKLGFYVLIIPETATELILNGIRPFGNSLNSFEFQRIVFEKQLHKEKLYRKVAKKLKADKIVILHDRGIIDNKSYVTESEFNRLLKEFRLNETEAKDRYDAVFHLVTAANGAEEFYTLNNNNARTETIEEARILDAKGISNWMGHPHFRVISNDVDFEGKMEKLMREIYLALEVPAPLEIERKYLITKPDINTLSKYVPITAIDIVQTYLKPVENVERRIRQRGMNGNFSYYYTEKREIDSLKRVEVEEKITEKDYIRYLAEVDTSLSPIVKKRICFVYNSQYFELDLFEFSKDLALMELELTSENDTVKLPDFVEVKKEVTGEKNYHNYNIAKTQML